MDSSVSGIGHPSCGQANSDSDRAPGDPVSARSSPSGRQPPSGVLSHLPSKSPGATAIAQPSLAMPSPGAPGAARAAVKHVDPATRSETCGDTRQLAALQTTAARQVLYQPSESLRHELGQAANSLHPIYAALDAQDKQALGARLFGAEGLMPGRSPSALLDVLSRVGRTPDRSSAHDRAIVIALMGDIGALYAATGATTGTDRLPEASVRLRANLSERLAEAGLAPPPPRSIQSVQEEGGSRAVGPDKTAERTRPAAAHFDRTGIHNLGEDADEIIGVPRHARIPPTQWDVAHIAENRVDGTVEPFAGHMSGSPAEILQTWDMLRGEPAERQFVGTLHTRLETRAEHHDPMQVHSPAQQVQHLARAAGACAFLVGLGYHSTVEVIEGALTYLGQSMRRHDVLGAGQRDAGHLFGQGAATELMSELFQGHQRVPDPASPRFR
ncbi:hypothetical protein DR63_4805 [Burkholderia thailandensis E264]|nr:hypothetical protein [Burkholderia thailandensis]AIP27670.1 hypothetical protein DR63_4805 [Burkholderia thailandensis E264]